MSDVAGSVDLPRYEPMPPMQGPLVYRQSVWTRLTHWTWVIAMFFLLLSGLEIFNAHPALYIGRQSGFQFKNEILRIGSEDTASGPVGYTEIFGHRFNTTGVLGFSTSDGQQQARAFPAWATIPSYYDLGTGRVIHFFFAWIFAFTLLTWYVSSIVNGHLKRDLAPKADDLRKLPHDIAAHARLKFHHTREYNTLQKMSYGGVLFVLMPLMIITGLAMSPNFNATVPFLNTLLGGRQTARTIHFLTMNLLVLFFIVHVLMVLAAGPLNELRSIVTGWYRTDPPARNDRKIGRI